MDQGTETAWRILREFTTFAIVGASPRPERPSNEVMAFLREEGYTTIPVNPHAPQVLGQTTYPDLRSVPVPVEVVDIFRRSELVAPHVDEAIAIGARAIWMQLGVVDEESAARARAAGLLVVMDRCPAIELPRLRAAS